jgi:Spy/CpxP family protein refolding chaperone
MRVGKLALVVAAGLLLAGVVVSQPPGGPGGPPGSFGFGGFGGGLAGMIGQSRQLQDELKVDRDQADKLNEALAKVREDLRDEMGKLRDRTLPQEKREEILKKVSEANTKAVASVLKPEQVKRLQQIENQQAGAGMFTREDVQKTLKLSDEQKDKIKAINEALQKDLRDSQPGPGGFPEFMKKRQELQKEALDNVAKVLKDDQKAALKDLTGAPFEMRMEGFAGGGFGFGGPGGPGGPGGFGPGGPGGFGGGGFGGFGGGFGPPAQPGQLLSPAVVDRLKLTPDQKKQLEDLQKDIDSKLGKILTDEQKKQLKDLQDARPGGPGGPGRGPGGPPPGR